ncbi:MAG: PD-(D/E)XK nuclease family protein [Planctomycetaceae bacterium]|nr:PD-(D/E)XK nuclease family protein [Planctomycetaceae bacterium]
MDRTLESLASICRNSPWERKWLLGPSLSAGTQWIDSLARQQVPCINLIPATCDTLAREWARPVMIREGLNVLPDDVGPLILQAAWEQLPRSGYFRRLPASVGVLNSLVQTVADLRMHETRAEQLRSMADAAHSRTRLTDLAMLLEFWEAWLETHAFVDQAGILTLARRAICDASLTDCLVLVSEDVELEGVAQRFLEEIPDSQRHWVSIGQPPLPRDQSSASTQTHFFRAIGAANEIRGVLRRIVESKLPLDHVEILTTDVSQTAELLLDLLPEEKEGGDGLSRITLAQGLPISRSRPARALLGFVLWAQAEFGVQQFCQLLESELIPTGEQWGPVLAAALRRLGIKAGADHYVPAIDRELQRLQDSHLQTDDSDRQLVNTQVSRLQMLRGLCEQWIPAVQTLLQPGQSSFAAALQLLDGCVVRDAVDATARATIAAALQRQSQWQNTLGVTLLASSWLPTYLSKTRILQSTPRPGCLHVSSVFTGGQTGRPVCFVTGMEDRVFPGNIRQDPALSDAERQTLREDMVTGAQRHASGLRHVRRILSQDRERLFLSWSCASPDDGSELFAARLVHELAMENTQTSAEDWSQLLLDDVSEWPQSYAISDHSSAVNVTESRILTLLEHDAPRTLLEAMHPHFAAGRRAIQHRLENLNEYSGDVSLSTSGVTVFDNSQHVYSASALETLGRCPLAFFFSRRLKGFRAEEYDADLDRWLDPAVFGRLVHELFQKFLTSLQGAAPDFNQHWPQLKAMVVELGQQYERNYPPVSRSSCRQDLAKLLRIARTFLNEETRWYRRTGAIPAYFEATLGMPRRDDDTATALDCAEPVPLILNSGRRIFGHAQVDRIDRLSEHRYAICDYKTGSAWGYAQQSPFQGGRHLQSTFYTKLVQKVLRTSLSEQHTVTQFDYFFPGIRGDGLRVGWEAAQLEPGVQVLENLVELDQTGVYAPTNCADDCRFCDYRSVCGNVTELARAAAAWYQNDERLNGLREARDDAAK